MFDFPDEATSALASKSQRNTAHRTAAHDDDPESWAFLHLVASPNEGVIHVKFKQKKQLVAEYPSELRTDFSQLADLLVNDSRVVLDF
ncbi:MAG: hypothetical protein AAFV88_12390, partial [Planctomycetota bacterium]